MLRNYFLTAFRGFLRQRSYSFINLSGLAVGLTCSIFIFLWVVDEVSFNDFHPDRDRIYQVLENQTYSGNKIYTFAATPGILAEALKQELPEIEYSSRMSWGERMLFNYEDKSIYEQGHYADPSFFKVFNFQIIDGDKENPLPDNNSVAISQKTAKKYFGDENAVGKIFRINNEFDCKVTVVFQDIPANSSIETDFIIAFDRTFREPGNKWMGDWDSNGVQTYVKLLEPGQQSAVDEKIKGFVKKRKEGSVVEFFLFPMTDWRLYGNYEGGKPAGGRITYVRAFSLVAVFVLVIACINFMNLATARAANRSREVGVRKVVGAQRKSLIAQFIGESLLMTFVAMLISLLLVHLLMPYFNDLTGKHISIDYSQPLIPLTLLSILLVTGFVSGSYPAFFLSAFQPAAVLKGNTGADFAGARLRKALVVFQFTLSVALIVCALVVYQQIGYIRNKNLGYDRENVMYFTRYEGVRKSFDSFRSEVMQNPAIINVSLSSHLPMDVGQSSGAEWDGKLADEKILFPLIQVDYEFIKMMNYQLLEGRLFSREFASDSSNYVIMEETARRMKMKDPIGQRLKVWGKNGKIIGVVKDFHVGSLHQGIEPAIFILQPEVGWNVFVKYQPGKAEEAKKVVEAVQKKFESAFPFEPNFLDDAFDRQYKSEFMVGKLSAIFTGMTIFISCLGLFGLASYTTERRTKEIGVRKALGASVARLTLMLCRDFVVLVFFALVIGCPIAWYVMDLFLDQYKFHTDLSPAVFALTGAAILAIAILTVAYRSIQAALSNPVKALRSE